MHFVIYRGKLLNFCWLVDMYQWFEWIAMSELRCSNVKWCHMFL